MRGLASILVAPSLARRPPTFQEACVPSIKQHSFVPSIFMVALAATTVAIALAEHSFAQDTLPKPAAAPATAGNGLDTYGKQLSYSIGVNLGREWRRGGLPIDIATLAAGINDAFSGGQLKMTDEQRQAVFDQLNAQLQSRRREQMLASMPPGVRAQAERNYQAGQAFLNQNATKPGVKTTASGLQYRVITPGKGATPRITDTVRCHYEGRLIDGKVFDASARHGTKPAEFPLRGVIPGWTEALQLMKVGAKWELYIPSGLAYGIDGQGPDIGPDATLIFTIDLVEIAR